MCSSSLLIWVTNLSILQFLVSVRDGHGQGMNYGGVAPAGLRSWKGWAVWESPGADALGFLAVELGVGDGGDAVLIAEVVALP